LLPGRASASASSEFIEENAMRKKVLVVDPSLYSRMVSQAFSAGAAGFCAKPYREKNVKATLRNLNRQPIFS
jgi:FixJ family two-component response regulator